MRKAYRIYTNAVLFGDVAFVHPDSCDAEHVTALFYSNPEWASEFGGETVFYDEDASEWVKVWGILAQQQPRRSKLTRPNLWWRSRLRRQTHVREAGR